ncbi:ParB/RepB/Spo0J family partition protein [Primorskyibacter sp. S187A]|uniref:ParB/RepB/Spo0J family partition protein n=1 Tax=Primorskyibacter sp. S187A TaxID=3415130 RepID=UPI003C7C838A
MARRKRLTPPRPDYLESESPAPKGGPLSMPPIAQVAGEAASSAALQTLSDEMARARAEGRFIETLPLDAIEAHHLVRDRMDVSDEDQAALIASLQARGQQTPIEVVSLGEGRYGLIAGWRRLMALRHLFEETGAARFGTIEARITRPGEAAEAYCAMVEENEIRVGLSYFERARIALRAVEEGVYPDLSAALNSLYSSASRPKKSKIRSFVSLVQALDGVLQFPTSIGERLGLGLAKALSEDAALPAQITSALQAASPASAEAEQDVLRQSLIKPKIPETTPPAQAGVSLKYSAKTGEVRLLGVDAALVADLKLWLAAREG